MNEIVKAFETKQILYMIRDPLSFIVYGLVEMTLNPDLWAEKVRFW